MKTKIFCDTLVEYLGQIVSRRSRELQIQDSPVRRLFAFDDPEKDERILVKLTTVKKGLGDRLSLEKVSARFEYTPDQIADMLRTPEGRAQLLRM
jgi:hypothetical protein